MFEVAPAPKDPVAPCALQHGAGLFPGSRPLAASLNRYLAIHFGGEEKTLDRLGLNYVSVDLMIDCTRLGPALDAPGALTFADYYVVFLKS